MIELARCHQCAALMPDTAEDRRDHVAEHHNTKKRLDAMTRSLQYLNGELEKALARVEELETATPVTAEFVGDPLTINEFPDDETETGDDTDLADLQDLVDAGTEAADATDDLDARIANLSGVAPTVGGVA